VSVMDTGIDYNNPDLYLNIWINQAEIPASRLKNLVDVNHDGYISFRDLNNPINQGVGKITDVNHDGRIDAADILAPMVLDAAGKDTGQGGWAYAGNTQDGDTAHPNDFIGWNFVAGNNNPLDDNGHGTNVAGVIGAVGNNGVGVAGINWNASLMDLKVFDSSGFADIGDIISALGYAVKHGARVLNNSWSGASPSQDLLTAMTNARNAGQIFVAAAGNGGFNNDANPDFPTYYDQQLNNIVAVAAVDRNGKLPSFSDYGAKTVALGAPGVDVVSTARNGGTSSYTGTSQATAFVSGVMALVWGEHPSWTYQQVINRVLKSVTPLASLKGKTQTGGMVNAAAAAAVVVTPRVASAVFSGPAGGSLNRILLTFNEPVDPTTVTASDIHLTGPSGAAVALTAVRPVSGWGNKQYEVLFATQTTLGNYTLAVGSQVVDVFGAHLVPSTTVYTLGKTYTFSSSAAVTIPATGKVSSTVAVNPSVVINSVRVVLNISYGKDGALYIHVVAPNGTDILLANQVGGTGQNFTNTVFDDRALTSISFGSAPFTGSYQPAVPLSFLKGANAQGKWTLWVEVEGSGGTGTINSWSLEATTAQSAAPADDAADAVVVAGTAEDGAADDDDPTVDDIWEA